MNRRKLLKGVLGVGVVSLAGRAVVEERANGVTSLVPVKAEGQTAMYDAEELMPFTPARHAWLDQQYDKYWEQQWLISELHDQ